MSTISYHYRNKIINYKFKKLVYITVNFTTEQVNEKNVCKNTI